MIPKIKFMIYKAFLAKIPVIRDRFSPFRNSMFHSKGALYSSSYGKDISSVKNGKWVVIGLPKSGNNWLMYLIADCLDLQFVHPTKDIKKPGVSFTHQQFSPRIVFRKDFVFGTYIIRDIRDIIVSFYYYSQTDYFHRTIDPSCLFKDIASFYFEYFLSHVIPRHNWQKHPDKYIEHGIPLIKYENLWDNTEQELRNLFLRCGIRVNNNKIIQAIDNNKIDKLSRTGKTIWEQIPTTHFRNGGYGGYKNCLPQKVLDDVNRRFKNYLRRWGYDCF